MIQKSSKATDSLTVTPNPTWVNDFLTTLEPYKRRIVDHTYFLRMADGTLPLQQFRYGLLYFYPLIQAFPKYMGLTLARIPPSDELRNRTTSRWLLSNMSVEKAHADWWRLWARGFGIGATELDKDIEPSAQMDAINNYLWRICTYGTVAEAVSATNFAIEGPTGEWTKRVSKGLRLYGTRPGIRVNKQTLLWATHHAEYDDKHPVEALEIIKMYALTEADQRRVTAAAKRAMEYYATALDECCNQI